MRTILLCNVLCVITAAAGLGISGCTARSKVIVDQAGGVVEVQDAASGATRVKISRDDAMEPQTAAAAAAQIDAVHRELLDLQTQRDGVHRELAAAIEQREQAVHALENAATEVDQAERAVVVLNQQIEQLGSTREAVEQELAALVTARDKMQVGSADLQRELDALRGQAKTLASEKTAAAEAMAVVRFELAEANEKLAAAGVEIRQREQKLRQLDEARRAAEQTDAAARPDEHRVDVEQRIPQAEEPAETSPPSTPAVPEPVEEAFGPALIDRPQAWWSRGLWLGLVVSGLAVVGVVIFSSCRLLSRIMPDVLTVGLTELTADGSNHHRMQIDRTQGLVFETPPRVLPLDGAAKAELPWIRRGVFSRLVLARGADGEEVNLNGESLDGSESCLCEGDRITIGQHGSRRVFVVQTVTANEELELFAQEPETV